MSVLPGSTSTAALRAGHAPGRRRAQAGFTLMEILIAMIVLMVGLVGIMAVFPHAMQTANSTVEKSYAVAIARSVVDTIELGLREQRTPYEDWQAFIFDHDGTRDLDADRRSFLRDLNLADLKTASGELKPAFHTLLRKDYCIVLPRPTETQTVSGGGTPTGRAFLYPRANTGDNAGRVAARYVDYEGGRKLEVKKVYQLGRRLKESQSTDEVTRELEQNDPLSQYGFAFTIRATKAPTPDNPTADRRRQRISPGLYEVVVRVYRNFNPNKDSRDNDPIERFVTYIGAR